MTRPFKLKNDDARRGFYELLSPQEVSGNLLSPKLENANRQVRQMKDIVDKPIPLKILLDPEADIRRRRKSCGGRSNRK